MTSEQIAAIATGLVLIIGAITALIVATRKKRK